MISVLQRKAVSDARRHILRLHLAPVSGIFVPIIITEQNEILFLRYDLRGGLAYKVAFVLYTLEKPIARGIKKKSHDISFRKQKNMTVAKAIAAAVCPDGKEYPPADNLPASAQYA